MRRGIGEWSTSSPHASSSLYLRSIVVVEKCLAATFSYEVERSLSVCFMTVVHMYLSRKRSRENCFPCNVSGKVRNAA